MALAYEGEEGLWCKVEDYVWPRLGTAMVKRVLPSNPLVPQVGQGYC